MQNDYSLYEKIDLYLKNALSEEDQRAFDIELNKDSALKELVNTQRIANKIVLTKQLISIQTKIQSDLSKQKRWYNSRSLLWVGLSVLSSALFLFYFIKSSDTTSTFKVSSSSTISTSHESIKNTSEPSNSAPKNGHSKKSNLPNIILQSNDLIPVESNPTTIGHKIDSTDKFILSEQKVDPLTEAIPKTEPTKIDCSLITIDHDALSIFATCEGEQNGKILVSPSKIHGGKTPFVFGLNQTENLSNKSEFHFLSAGSYKLYLLDANNCLIIKNIEIEEKSCKKSNRFAFTPELEKWKIPVQQNKQGILKIFNKSGILVFSSEVSSDNENLWDGTSSNGDLLETGYFTYKINYSDGEEEIGSVSILHR